ncbi:homoprotocatechuate degradation operon regulator, HpaR [Colwellia psychrerythraea]|uniref:Homoprotocatechuate degradation operon regulator, HpaR n=1 Tax=Colwellia psychrerythraea TaxID=28229 RepID=A0A1Y5EM56_COLPS|nr:homoprotocatechuate degradation operon regulator, HpaR [Colwellia psychrerythraea]
MTKRLRSFERSLPMTLLQTREAVMKKFIPSLKEHGLTPQQWRVIRALEHENGLEISTLAKRCHLLMPSLSRIINHLDKETLIQRKTVDSDQRRSKIFLTELGLELFSKVAPKSVERYVEIEEKYGVRKLELLYELLDDLIKTLEENDI